MAEGPRLGPNPATVADLLARIDDVVAGRLDLEGLRAWVAAHRREVAAGGGPGARWLCDRVTDQLAVVTNRRNAEDLAKAALREVRARYRLRWA